MAEEEGRQRNVDAEDGDTQPLQWGDEADTPVSGIDAGRWDHSGFEQLQAQERQRADRHQQRTRGGGRDQRYQRSAGTTRPSSPPRIVLADEVEATGGGFARHQGKGRPERSRQQPRRAEDGAGEEEEEDAFRQKWEELGRQRLEAIKRKENRRQDLPLYRPPSRCVATLLSDYERTTMSHVYRDMVPARCCALTMAGASTWRWCARRRSARLRKPQQPSNRLREM